MSFESHPRFLRDLLDQAHARRLQLPDFQRTYVWGDDDVRLLLASILRGFPVGALLTLRTGGEVNFRPRLLEGVNAARQAAGEGPAVAAEELLLDGQQRITSLYGALQRPLQMTVRKPKSERDQLKRFSISTLARRWTRARNSTMRSSAFRPAASAVTRCTKSTFRRAKWNLKKSATR